MAIYSDMQTSSRASVFMWYRRPKRGRHSLEYNTRIGRPATAATIQNAEAVRKLIRENHEPPWSRYTIFLALNPLQVNQSCTNALVLGSDAQDAFHMRF